MTLSDCVSIQRDYKKLGKTIPFSKKNMCDLLNPYKEKFGLTDREVLAIARNELSLSEINDFLVAHSSRSNKTEWEAYAVKEKLYRLVDAVDVLSVPTDDFRHGLMDYLFEHGVTVLPDGEYSEERSCVDTEGDVCNGPY